MNNAFKDAVQSVRGCLILNLIPTVSHDMAALTHGVVEKHQPNMIGTHRVRDRFRHSLHQGIDIHTVLHDVRCRRHQNPIRVSSAFNRKVRRSPADG